MQPCEFCGKGFEPKRKTQKFCHVSCSQAASNARRTQKGPLFEEPREFKVLTIRDIPDGYKVIIINDTQIPFQEKRTLAAIERFWDDFQPDLEIYNGDIFDFYEISSFDKNPSRTFRLQDELDVARAWLYGRAERNPNARRILIEGNHEDRLRRWLWKKGPEVSSLRVLSVESLLGLDEMKIESLAYGNRINLCGFLIEHGERSSRSDAYPINVARLMAISRGSSGLCGHDHHFGVYCWTDSRGDHTYINNGNICGQPEYRPFPNWQAGFTYGIVIAGVFYPTPTRVLKDGFRAEGEFYKRSK